MSEKKKANYQNEDDCRCFAASRNDKTCPPVRNVTHPLRYYEFTQDEIRALEECDKESFYRRCLPFSALLASATYAGVKGGYLKTNPHFGVYPKMLVAMLIGHVLGRVAYSPFCNQRLRRLPKGSKVGDLLRDYQMQHEQEALPKKK